MQSKLVLLYRTEDKCFLFIEKIILKYFNIKIINYFRNMSYLIFLMHLCITITANR